MIYRHIITAFAFMHLFFIEMKFTWHAINHLKMYEFKV